MKLDLVLENTRNQYNLGLLEESDGLDEKTVLQGKILINESIMKIRGMLVEEGTIGAVQNVLQEAWTSAVIQESYDEMVNAAQNAIAPEEAEDGFTAGDAALGAGVVGAGAGAVRYGSGMAKAGGRALMNGVQNPNMTTGEAFSGAGRAVKTMAPYAVKKMQADAAPIVAGAQTAGVQTQNAVTGVKAAFNGNTLPRNMGAGHNTSKCFRRNR